jgi:hypothetical protein
VSFFKLDISKTRLEILIAFLHIQGQLVNTSCTLRDLGRICNLDYINMLYREKDWLCETGILKTNNDQTFTVDFDRIADLLFEETNFSVIYDFAHKYEP